MIAQRFVKRLEMEISPLGAGIMRFQSDNGAFSLEAFKLLDLAMAQGVNYFDTAFLYNAGHSEEFIRHALVEKYPRDRFIIADKLPVWLCRDRDEMERIFNIQMERLGVDYIDIYLLHSLHVLTWTHVYNHGVLDFLEEKKREGRIRKTGFSFHDNADKLPMIADAYGWDMAQLQINYYDWVVHDVKQSYEYLLKKDIPIVTMEPVGGGRLVKLPEQAENRLKTASPEATIPSWAIRFCASLPGVEVVLSGMRTEAELNDNVSCFNPAAPLSEADFTALEDVARIIQGAGAIPCSACRYCTDGCPAGIDIPHTFQQYNDYKMFNRPASLTWAYIDMVPPTRRADKCVNCGQCSDICPQKINIPEQLGMVHERALLLALFNNNENFSSMLEEFVGKDVVFFGAGAFGKSMLAYARKHALPVSFFCDNGSHLWGTEVENIKVISPTELKDMYGRNNVRVLITNQYGYSAIKEQLLAMGINPVN